MTWKTFKMSRKSNNKRNLMIGRILILEQSIRDKVHGGRSRKHGISNAGHNPPIRTKCLVLIGISSTSNKYKYFASFKAGSTFFNQELLQFNYRTIVYFVVQY